MIVVIFARAACDFYDKFAGSFGRPHKSELKELADVTAIPHLNFSPLAIKYRWEKHF